MTDAEYARKLDELDRLLNDPDVPMEPAKVWSLLAEIAQRDVAMGYAPRTEDWDSDSLSGDQKFAVALGPGNRAVGDPEDPPTGLRQPPA